MGFHKKVDEVKDKKTRMRGEEKEKQDTLLMINILTQYELIGH